MKTRQRLDRLQDHSAFPAALGVVTRLREAGFQAVFAGGCVRDGLMGLPPKDLDIATSAPPEAVEKAFPRTLAVGKAFGTILVMEDGHPFEVTTFRKEGPYHDGRRPSHVHFTDIEEDAARRDFTVNALFYDPLEGTVLDFAGGLEDLKSRKLRTVGRAEERFAEDRLRMLRAVRFVAQLGFDLDPQALAAVRTLRADLKSVSAERILAEVKRLLTSPHLIKGLEMLITSKLYESFWPEMASVRLDRLQAFPPFVNWENTFAAIMLSAEAGSTDERLRAWKASRESLRRVDEQVRAVRILIDPKTPKAARLRALGSDVYPEILVLAEGLLELSGRGKELETCLHEYLQAAGPDGKLPAPWISGQDLLEAGVAPGARFGEILKELYDEQLEGRIRSRDEALKRIPKS